jgi:hypothetical protein
MDGLGKGGEMITALLISINPYLTVVGVFADVLGIGGFAFAIFALLKSRRKYKRLINSIRKLRRGGVIRGVLIIGIPGSIKIDVMKYLTEENIDVDDEYIKEIVTEGYLLPEDNYEIGKKIRRYKQEFSDLGVDRLLLFTKAPVYMGVIIGSILTNWKPVDLYHNVTIAEKSTYQYQETLTGILKTGI